MKRILILILFSMTIIGCYSIRALKYRSPSVTNYKKFPTIPIQKGQSEFSFIKNVNTALQNELDSLLIGTNTNAFIVIKNDTVIYENYFNAYNNSQLQTSFSVAKSFVSVLMGIAIDQGKIKSVNEPITTFIPELLKTDKRFEKVTIQHVLDMRSGFNFVEYSNNPFGEMAKLYYGKGNSDQLIFDLKVKKESGKDFDYSSIQTQVLSMIIERAVGAKINDYMQQHIWQPLGMQSNATWSIDNYKDKNVKSYCCINAIPLDFAKFGRLALNNGNWNGKQIVSKEWMSASVSKDEIYKYANGFFSYHNCWWGVGDTFVKFKDSTEAATYKSTHKYTGNIKKSVRGNHFVLPEVSGAFSAEGMRGQFIYVNPNNKVIIVRMGDDTNKRFNLFNYETWTMKEFIQIFGQNL